MGDIKFTIKTEIPSKPVDAFAITDIKEEIFDFRWDVKHFEQRLQNKDPNNILMSPTFTFEAEDKKSCYQWQVKIFWKKQKKGNVEEEDEFLSIFMYFVNAKKSTRVAFHCELLNNEISWLKRLGECDFNSVGGNGWNQFLNVSMLLDKKNKLLEDDTLKLRFQVKMRNDSAYVVNKFKGEAKKKSRKRKYSLISSYSNLFCSKTFADVSIKTKTSILKAHKAILSCRSPVFFAMFQSEMSEAINNEVDVPDFDEEVVKGMLEYIYCGEISLECMTRKSHEIFQIADKYDIAGLQEEAEEHIGCNLSINNVVDALILADKNQIMDIKSKAMKFINKNKAELKKNGGFQKIMTYSRSLIEELYLVE